MLTELRSHLTYANVMVTLIAFAVLGGGVVAIGGVTDEQGKIQACYDKKGSNQGEVRLLVKGSCDSKTEKAIAWSQQGPPGPAGEPGKNGTKGTFGSIRTTSVPYTSGGPATASCNPGEVAIGGGAETSASNGYIRISRPSPPVGLNPTGWEGQLLNTSNVAVSGIVYVVCAVP